MAVPLRRATRNLLDNSRRDASRKPGTNALLQPGGPRRPLGPRAPSVSPGAAAAATDPPRPACRLPSRGRIGRTRSPPTRTAAAPRRCPGGRRSPQSLYRAVDDDAAFGAATDVAPKFFRLSIPHCTGPLRRVDALPSGSCDKCLIDQNAPALCWLRRYRCRLRSGEVIFRPPGGESLGIPPLAPPRM
jgi:hypothetical protein